MEELFRKDHPGQTFASWDWWYYAEKLRKKNYALDEEMLRPYFSLENVQSGIFFLANRLYGITFRPIVVPVYHPEATAYEVLDLDETRLGVLYFDYFPRAGKSQGRGAATTSSRSTQTARASRPWCRSSATSPRPAGGALLRC